MLSLRSLISRSDIFVMSSVPDSFNPTKMGDESWRDYGKCDESLPPQIHELLPNIEAVHESAEISHFVEFHIVPANSFKLV